MVILETERLLFRHHEPNDIEAYCAVEADPDVRRYVGGHPRPREDAERRFLIELSKPPDDRLRLWAAVYKPESRYVGRCGVYPHFGDGGPIPGEGVLAFHLAREYWGRGLATEAGRAFIAFGFVELALTRIVTMVDLRNAASIRVLEKLGFELIGTGSGGRRSFGHYELRNGRHVRDNGP